MDQLGYPDEAPSIALLGGKQTRATRLDETRTTLFMIDELDGLYGLAWDGVSMATTSLGGHYEMDGIMRRAI